MQALFFAKTNEERGALVSMKRLIPDASKHALTKRLNQKLNQVAGVKFLMRKSCKEARLKIQFIKSFELSFSPKAILSLLNMARSKQSKIDQIIVPTTRRSSTL